eukprot:COSAG06_NODE_371_length_16707_cov_57.805576_21_plen_144_part_00
MSFEQLYIKPIILPRQARDKHRERSLLKKREREMRLSQGFIPPHLDRFLIMCNHNFFNEKWADSSDPRRYFFNIYIYIYIFFFNMYIYIYHIIHFRLLRRIEQKQPLLPTVLHIIFLPRQARDITQGKLVQEHGLSVLRSSSV